MTSATRTAEQDRRRERGEVLEDGQAVHFNIMLMDSAPSNAAAYDGLAPELRPAAAAYDAMVTDLTQRDGKPAVSIDEELRKAIAQVAKAQGKSPEDWLAEQTDRDVQRLIEGVVTQSVASVRAATMASALGLDADPADPVASAYAAMCADLQRNAG